MKIGKKRITACLLSAALLLFTSMIPVQASTALEESIKQKQQAIKDAFHDWVWKDPTRRHELVTRYNELFNSTRPREYDGSHIVFDGMNPEITLREHQRNAIAHE